MSDSIDQATELSEREREAIVAHAVAAGQGAPSGAIWCDGCGGLIPEQRRACLPQTTSCVECASAAEARGRHFAR